MSKAVTNALLFLFALAATVIVVWAVSLLLHQGLDAVKAVLAKV